jgi:hypothetical protein
MPVLHYAGEIGLKVTQLGQPGLDMTGTGDPLDPHLFARSVKITKFAACLSLNVLHPQGVGMVRAADPDPVATLFDQLK